MENTIKPIRTFVRRERRLKAQAFPKTLWERYGINKQDSGVLMDYFKSPDSLTLEIGFGTGDTLFQQAKVNSAHGYIGIEVYKTGILHLLSTLAKAPLNNIRLIEGDAVQLLTADKWHHSVDRIQILFPDPWPKNRHHKRRLIQPAFVNLLYQTIKPGGLLYLATDWEPYARHMLSTLEESSFINYVGPYKFSARPVSIPLTKFEQRGQRLGHRMWYLAFKK